LTAIARSRRAASRRPMATARSRSAACGWW